VSATINPDHLVPEQLIDAELSFADVREPFYRIIKQMEPFGPENLKPVFIARGVRDTGFSKVVKDAHLKVSLRQGDVVLNGIGFNMREKMQVIDTGQPMDLVFRIDENEWNGQVTLQVKVIDLRVSA